ncbi:uncharacterized protein EV154DRAFT_509227 [Mucor mucedo]|uniref:uncharacterized protein n=1 Tax=Mucor mucedo TaxID=29922 RepID=UPI00221EC142|nr:uncharacterized protein EV154DRAFT_509227 [Mucor mucedo]KAI7891117.1 hypothetical protein EV154DRAFT_509227 [Mucor mucedo]
MMSIHAVGFVVTSTLIQLFSLEQMTLESAQIDSRDLLIMHYVFPKTYCYNLFLINPPSHARSYVIIRSSSLNIYTNKNKLCFHHGQIN